ncbi:tyrosine-type recombinase/integrase [Paenibacillus alvei]
MSLKKRNRISKLANNSKSYPVLSFGQAIDLVASGKRVEGVRDRTVNDYGKMWRYFSEWLDDNYEIESVDQLTIDMIRNYIHYMKYDKKKYTGHKYIDADKQEIGLSDTTININLRALKAIFNYLQREELIEINPLERIKLLRQDIDLTNCLTDEEVKTILKQPNMRDYVGYRDACALNLLLDSGLRANELLGLRVGDIDFKTRFITLPGERNKNRKPRMVPISTHVMKMLLQLVNENASHFKTDRVFLSCYGEPLGQNQFNKRLKYYAEKAGIEGKKVTAHVYRHTWAKNMILNGCDPFTLQKIGGWSDIRTMRRYIQMDTNEMRRSHDDYSPINRFK